MLEHLQCSGGVSDGRGDQTSPVASFYHNPQNFGKKFFPVNMCRG